MGARKAGGTEWEHWVWAPKNCAQDVVRESGSGYTGVGVGRRLHGSLDLTIYLFLSLSKSTPAPLRSLSVQPQQGSLYLSLAHPRSPGLPWALSQPLPPPLTFPKEFLFWLLLSNLYLPAVMRDTTPVLRRGEGL